MSKHEVIASRISELEKVTNPSGVEIHTLAYLRWLLGHISGGPNPFTRPRM